MSSSYSDRHFFTGRTLVDLTAIQDNFIMAPFTGSIVVHRVGILVGTSGSSGLVTVTFQKTVGGTGGTDTTIKALIVDDSLHAAGTIVYGVPTTPVVIGPGDYVNLLVPAETSGTAPAVAYALVEYSLLDQALADDASLIVTA